MVRCQKPQPQAWLVHTIGRSDLHLTSIASFWDGEMEAWGGSELRVALVVNNPDAKRYFGLLEVEKNQIVTELGMDVTWHNPADTTQAKIYVRRSANIRDRNDWPNQFSWLRTHLYSSVSLPNA